jgi:deoxyribose-phosphate aldolase
MDATQVTTPEEFARLIDHTLLRPETTCGQVEELCRHGLRYGFATVCVNPCHVPRCARLLEGSPVGVCTVVGFPLGANNTVVKAFEAEKACADGAIELDMVMNVGALLDGDRATVAADIKAVVTAASDQASVKVILETCLLDDNQKALACDIAVECGATFVKTSTGFGRGGATVHDVEVLRRAVGSLTGVKASGGIRTLSHAVQLIEAGATRLGTSAGTALVDELRARKG